MRQSKRTGDRLKAYDEARRNIFGNRRGLALIAAYEDRDLNRKFRKEYRRILVRDGLARRKDKPF